MSSSPPAQRSAYTEALSSARRVSTTAPQLSSTMQTSSSASRPATSAASPREAPNTTPGMTNASAQPMAATASAARNRLHCIPEAPATVGRMARRGPRNRARKMPLPP